MLRKKGFVYILSGLKNNKFYIGSTTDIKRRLQQHKLGNVKATRYLRPVKLELFQKYDTLNTARRVECRLKRLKRRDYIEKIIKEGLIGMGQ